MVIKFWGSRGSIPVSGREYLKYGGDTTCVEIRTKQNKLIIIDAGTGIRRLGNWLTKENEFDINIILTHAHMDHLWGFPFFKPIYNSKTKITILGCPFAQDSLKKILSELMTPPHFPLSVDDIKANITYMGECGDSFDLETLRVTPIQLNHPNKGLGYKFEEDNRTFVFLTDNELNYHHSGGLQFEEYMNFSKSADLLVHDAEFTEQEYQSTKSWGHSVYTDTLNLALASGVRQLGLFHHNQERSDSEVDAILQSCKEIIKQHKSSLKCFAVAAGMEIRL